MDPIVTDITFDEWVKFMFDHPVAHPAWYWASGLYWPEVSPTDQVAYITRLFEDSGSLLAVYSNAQIDQALIYLISPASMAMRVLSDEDVLWPDRKRCLLSFYETNGAVCNE